MPVTERTYRPSVLFVDRCPLCHALGRVPCRTCRGRLGAPGVALDLAGADSAVAAYGYDGAVRELVLALKYRNQRSVLSFLAEQLAAVQPSLRSQSALVTWVPTTAARRASRGFDQAELLAAALARRLRAPLRATLERLDAGSQTGRGVAARALGPSFVARRRLGGLRVVLVDDVVTTGATACAAVRALRAAGADEIAVRAVAVTPRRRPLSARTFSPR